MTYHDLPDLLRLWAQLSAAGWRKELAGKAPSGTPRPREAVFGGVRCSVPSWSPVFGTRKMKGAVGYDPNPAPEVTRASG